MRMLSAAVAAVLVAGAVTACTPDPAPTPTPTSFANEDEAFAAAEATYRAYIDAENARRSDPASSPAPRTFLIGAALDDDVSAEQQLEEAGIHVQGDSLIASAVASSTAGPPLYDRVLLQVCMDSRSTKIVNDAGEDVTPPNRTMTPLDVSLVVVNGDFRVESSEVGSHSC